MTMISTWAVLDRGDVPEGDGARMIEYECAHCGHEAELPVLGLPLAQLGHGVVFDTGRHAMPRVIRCRNCRRTFELA